MDALDKASFDDLERRACRIREDSEREELRKLVDLVGPRAAEMLASVGTAIGFLHSGTREVRRGAIQVLSWYWRVLPGTDGANAIVEIAKADTDPDVRREALSWLGAIYAGTDDVAAGVILARAVLDETEKVSTRKCAYDGLCALRWLVKPSWAISRFPDAVDWHYVREFLYTLRSVQPVDAATALKRLATCSISTEEKAISTAIGLLENGSHDQAIAAVTQLLRKEVGAGIRATAHLLRGQALIESGAIEDGLEDLSIAIELDPYRPKAYQLRAKAYEMLGNSQAASEDRRRAEEI